MRDDAFIGMVRLLPKNALSRFVGAATRWRAPALLRHAAMRLYAAAYGIDLSECEEIRRYDTFDTTLGARRGDTYLDAAALAEWDLAPGWTAHVALHGRRALSNVAGFEYWKLLPAVGLAYTFSP